MCVYVYRERDRMLSIYQEAIRVRALMVTSHYETFFVPFLLASFLIYIFLFFSFPVERIGSMTMESFIKSESRDVFLNL